MALLAEDKSAIEMTRTTVGIEFILSVLNIGKCVTGGATTGCRRGSSQICFGYGAGPAFRAIFPGKNNFHVVTATGWSLRDVKRYVAGKYRPRLFFFFLISTGTFGAGHLG